MNKEEIVTKVFQQIFERVYAVDTSDFLNIHIKHFEGLDTLWEETAATFDIDGVFGEEHTVQDMIDTLIEHWDGKELDGVNKDLQWVSLSTRSMPLESKAYGIKNPTWQPWQPRE